MNEYPLLYLQPLFDNLLDKIAPLLKGRFTCQGFHLAQLDTALKNCKAPWIVLGDRATLEWLRNHYSSAPFFAFVSLDAGETLESEWLSSESLLDYSQGAPEPERLIFALNRVYSQLNQAQQLQQITHQLDVQRSRLHDLNAIGAALSTERNLDNLLDKILASSMEITSSDSGSLYLVETRKDEDSESQYLRFKWSRNQSISLDFSEFTMQLNEQSIAGSVALHGQALNIPDVYELDPGLPYGFNKSYDQNTGYRSQSMLTVPMKNPQGEVIGILQMINKKQNWPQPLQFSNPSQLATEVFAYTQEDVELLSSLASQAAVAIENARLYAAIQQLFEGFIRASVQAIESRDPTTSGHSERVAVLTVGLAKQVDKLKEGPFKDIRFSRDDIKEIKYASLLHDFGKIGVREHVLVKSDKLYDHELSEIKHRFQLIRKSLENEWYRKKIELLLTRSPQEAEPHFAELERYYGKQLEELQQDMEVVLQANKPSILAEDVSERLLLIEQKRFEIEEQQWHLLQPFELSRLSIKKGSLDPDERKEIESHVTHTFTFLSQIPWTRELRNVPQIAHAHHEKLNGKGYPLGLHADEIPIQSKMMTIADIYDALTASDRPYKKALPVERALDILGFEVKDGMLDRELYELFKATRVYDEIMAA